MWIPVRLTGRGFHMKKLCTWLIKKLLIEIARQVRLRGIGGMILIDFIDMQKENQKKDIVGILQRELKKDKVKSIVCGMTSLGLVEMTRKRNYSQLDKELLWYMSDL